MEKELKELISLSYKNRFSIYYKPGYCLVRTYYKDGNQRKEIGETIIEAVNKTISFLKSQQKNKK